MKICLHKDAECLSKTIPVFQEKGTLRWGDVESLCLSRLSVSSKTRKTWKDEPAVFLMKVYCHQAASMAAMSVRFNHVSKLVQGHEDLGN